VKPEDAKRKNDQAYQVSAAQLEQSPLAQAPGSDAYDPVQCLREEVVRFKATNRFTPMEVTGFYIQAAVVLNYVEALEETIRAIKATALSATDGPKGTGVMRLAHIVRLCISSEVSPNTERTDRRGSVA
jgi:hypothetical protein